MFFGVFYYKIERSHATVKLGGFYQTQEEAISRLKVLLPDYKNYVNNTVINLDYVGWINTYEFGDFSSDYSVNQPQNTIHLFS